MSDQFVSRAGQKLQHAFDTWPLDVQDKTCADLGCSTGGFTDCMLLHGATKVYAVDNGYGVLEWKLRNDDRVVVMERTNAMHVELPEQVDFISIDVNWTRQMKVLPNALKLLKENGYIVSLLKTHYEAEKDWLVRGGIMKPEFVDATVEKVRNEISTLPVEIIDIIESPIKGKKGANKEFLIYMKKV
jgi:23S rRNA (cytidine1920-2'-O)/16S rRNA (cytidine1409-2'-O)-methyltransferase